MDKQCLNCGETFDAKRSTAKFCSDSCKLKYNRTHPIAPDESVQAAAPTKGASPNRKSSGKSPKGFDKRSRAHPVEVPKSEYEARIGKARDALADATGNQPLTPDKEEPSKEVTSIFDHIGKPSGIQQDSSGYSGVDEETVVERQATAEEAAFVDKALKEKFPKVHAAMVKANNSPANVAYGKKAARKNYYQPPSPMEQGARLRRLFGKQLGGEK